MANIGAYSRHKQLAELNEPLFTNNGDGANPLVYSPEEQKQRVMNNVMAGGTAVPFPTYTVATAPDATAFEGHVIYVSNGDAGTPTMAFSDGTDWLVLTSGLAIAAA